MLFRNNRRKGARVKKENILYVLEYVWFTTPEEIQRKVALEVLNEKIRVRDLLRAEIKNAVKQ